MAHWHDFNPWASKLIYAPSIEEWLDCLMLQEQREHYAAQAAQGKCDAYILPQPSGQHSMGLRVGPEGSDYLSPYCNPAKAAEIIRKFGGGQ